MNKLLIKNAAVITLTELKPAHSVLIENGTISHLCPDNEMPTVHDAHVLDARGAYLAPGFIDLHIHGSFGYGPETGKPEDLLLLSLELAKRGVAAFAPTLYCARPDVLAQQLHALLAALGKEKGAKILGFHVEGPFLSPHKPGVMKARDLSPADVNLLEKIYTSADGRIVSMTLAPELPHSERVIQFCLQHHILPQAGHTNATYDEFIRAVQQGVKHVTHLFNAMSPFNHRDPGAAGGALLTPSVSCEIIADGVHVHPDVVAFLRTVKSPDKLVLITDALRPTGLDEGPFIANGESVSLEGGAWHRTYDHVLAGSSLTMVQGVRNLIAWGYPLPQAVRCASANAAQLLGLKTGQIAPGYPADIVLLDADLHVIQTWINGQKI